MTKKQEEIKENIIENMYPYIDSCEDNEDRDKELDDLSKKIDDLVKAGE